jgi:hypothetical protein
MKKSLFLFLLLPVIGFSQDQFFSNGKIAEGTIVPTFNATELKGSTEFKSTTIEKLPPGTFVEVTALIEAKSTRRNFESHWYRVKAADTAGYVWGGDLAIAFEGLGRPMVGEEDLVKMYDKWFVAGISKCDTSDSGYPRFYGEARAIRNNEIIDTASFDPMHTAWGKSQFYGYNAGISKMGDEELPENVEFIKLSGNYEACAYEYGDVIFTYHKKELTMAIRESGASEGGFGYDWNYILPSDSGGEVNQIKIDMHHYSVLYEENEETGEEDETEVDSYSLRTFEWKKNELIEEKMKKYFESPEQAVETINQLLKDENWKELYKYYDLEETGIHPKDLISGDFFIRKDKPGVAHPGGFWKYKNPFPLGFKYLRTDLAEGSIHSVWVNIEIDMGGGKTQRGQQLFRMIKSYEGYQLLPN